MKPYKKFLLGMGTGILAAFYLQGLADGIMPDAERLEREIEHYDITETVVENHRGRHGLSFLKKTYYSNYPEVEGIFCYPKDGKREWLLYILKVEKQVVKESVKRGSECKDCHRRSERLPVDPSEPVETG